MIALFDEILVALVEMSVSLDEILVELVFILDSTLDISPRVRLPSISASLRIVTVPEVCPKDKSPVTKSPYISVKTSPSVALPSASNENSELPI